jgi:hypothetical protein
MDSRIARKSSLLAQNFVLRAFDSPAAPSSNSLQAGKRVPATA